MEAVISSVGEKAGEFAFDLIKREITYILNYKINVENLKEGVDDLKAARQRVQRSVEAARRKGEEIYKDVEMWLSKVDEKISEDAAAKLEEDEEKAKRRYLIGGFCPDFKSRYQLSKKAEKEADAIAELLEKGRFDSVSFLPAPRGKGFRAVDQSRNNALKRVMEALKNDHSNIIGVHWMGGTVGMTKLVKQIARLAKEEQLFDEVVVAAVTQTPNLERIQSEIGENLGLKLDEASLTLDVKRLRLLERLKTAEKKVLVILDDIWATLDLEALGIPSRGEHIGCKILLTSTNLTVLSSMGIQMPFAINILNGSEAWSYLLKNMAADLVQRSDLYCTTIEVAHKCAQLPIAITRVAKALENNKTLFEWKNALEELKWPSLRYFQRKSAADAYSLEVAKDWVWSDSGRVEFMFGSVQVLVDFGYGSFQVRVTKSSNCFEFESLPFQITIVSGLLQVWTTSNSNHFKFELF